MIKRIATMLVVVSAIFTGSYVQAARVVFETSTITAAVGDTIVFHVRLNTEGASINATELGILYPGVLAVQNISKSGSFVQIWVKEPSYTGGTIFLSGGVPGGVVSSNALVATITFEAKSIGDGALGLGPASSVLLNDGSGTSVPISVQTSTIHVIARKPGQTPHSVSQDVSTKQAKSDFVRPERFGLMIATDARLFGGKHFISFFTTDSGSGLDHYEVKEGDTPYMRARSPYLLSDQTLHSVIHLRAYDSAGNYREEIYPGLLKRIWWGILRLVHL